jgi:ribonuclease BN (tRNA processing enzyme)
MALLPSFTVLASGSAGNSSLLESDGFGLLVDIGLGPRQLAARLSAAGRSWQNVHAALLTHTHSDHWNIRTLRALLAKEVPIYCHGEHLVELRAECPDWLVARLEVAGLLRTYSDDEFICGQAVRCLPLELRHDSGPTFGFRFAGMDESPDSAWSLGYAADLGSWDERLVEALCDVDVLALEFNHDVEMQRTSGRHPLLIARVLGDDGHLSNEQAAEFLHELLRRSIRRNLQRLVQLHLSRQCNRPAMAIAAAQAVVERLGVALPIHAAAQQTPSPTFTCGRAPVERWIQTTFRAVG